MLQCSDFGKWKKVGEGFYFHEVLTVCNLVFLIRKERQMRNLRHRRVNSKLKVTANKCQSQNLNLVLLLKAGIYLFIHFFQYWGLNKRPHAG